MITAHCRLENANGTSLHHNSPCVAPGIACVRGVSLDLHPTSLLLYLLPGLGGSTRASTSDCAYDASFCADLPAGRKHITMAEGLSFAALSDFAKRNYIWGLTGIGLVISYGLFTRYRSGGVCRCTTRMEGKTVLITGSNTGIGAETAKDMARRGARVIMACRDTTKAQKIAAGIREETGNGNVIVEKLDLSSLKSVRDLSKKIIQSEDRLDVLINNAGIMACPQWKTEDGFEMQFGTNHLGHFLLTHSLLDLIKKSAPSRIINVSSLAHEGGKMHWDDLNLEKNYGSWKAYMQSKLANILFTKELAKRLNGTDVTTYSVHPGSVQTELQRHLLAPLQWCIGAFSKTPFEGAQTQIHCAVSPDLANETGRYYSDVKEKKPAAAALDEADAERLWNESLKMLGLANSS